MRQCVLAVVLMVSFVPAAAGQAQEFKWKFGPSGERFYLETTTALKQTTKVMGQATGQETEQVTVTSFTVRKSDTEGAVLEQRIESITIPKSTGATPPIAGIAEQMKGTTFTITLNNRNQVTKLDGYEEFIKKVAGEDANSAKVVRAMQSEELLKQLIEEAFAFLPSQPVKPGGDPWERKSTIGLGPLGSLNTTHIYTYEGKIREENRDLDKINFKATMVYQKPTGDNSGLPFQITKGDLKVEDVAGSLRFDPAAGKLVRSEMKMRIKGTLTISSAGQEYAVELDQEHSVRTQLSAELPASAR